MYDFNVMPKLYRYMTILSLIAFLFVPMVFAETEEIGTPPHIIGCTRIEVKYQPSVMKFFYPLDYNSILNSEEIEDLNSLSTITCENPSALVDFSNTVSYGEGVYGGAVTGPPRLRDYVEVTCFRGDNKIACFSIFNTLMITEEELSFEYPKGFPTLERLTPQIIWYKLRAECAMNLSCLKYWLDKMKRSGTYPKPDQWCEDLIQTFGEDVIGIRTQNHFICPSVKVSHYAMNDDCETNSSPETVYLFESNPGWNQHGGPELFNFDNHDPKGGCALLKNGTVKFIRTEEELRKLRWR